MIQNTIIFLGLPYFFLRMAGVPHWMALFWALFVAAVLYGGIMGLCWLFGAAA